MNDVIFNSNSYFTVFDFSDTQGRLIIRSSKDDEHKKNVDVVFFGVRYMQLDCLMHSLAISKMKTFIEFKPNSIIEGILKKDDYYIFKLTSNNDESYFVVASFIKVFENQLEFKETLIGGFNPGTEILKS